MTQRVMLLSKDEPVISRAYIYSFGCYMWLQQIPDAQGTFEFFHVLHCIVDSYLDEKITPLQRIHKAWYAVFFCRCCMAQMDQE